MTGWLRAGATALAVLAVDQMTKVAADGSIDRGDSVNVFFGLDLTNSRNDGVAFGALDGSGVLIAIAITLALGLLIGYFALNSEKPLLWLPTGMLLGGAIGNLIDRAREGAVIDFIDPVAWPAFNFADMSIVVGVLVLLYVIEGPPGEA